MTKAELNQIAFAAAHDVLDRNMDAIRNQVQDSLRNVSENGKVSPDKATVALSALCMTLTPELSATVTAEMLVRLGLVSVEEDQ